MQPNLADFSKPGVLSDNGTVLLLEDDHLLAKYFGKMLNAVGVADVAIAHSNSAATKILEDNTVTAAFINVSLNDETSEQTAHLLIKNDIPFTFASGRSLPDTLGKIFPTANLLLKPARIAQIKDMLTTLNYKTD